MNTPSMYAFHKQIHVPTGIEHSIYCNFYNSHTKSLVVAGASQLRVFRLIQDVEKSASDQDKAESSKMKLECMQTFSLFGNVMSLQSVRFPDYSHDTLLLSFSDAKLSFVEYDPKTHDLRTVSLHYFEDDSSKVGRNQIFDIPHVRVDPDNRCAAMLIYGKEIVIFPFKKDSGNDATADQNFTHGRSPILSSYKVKIQDMDEKMSNVLDLQFLYGYYEPTLLVLYEPIKTWAGRVAVRQDTCSMVAISLNIQQKVHPIIWSLDNLPFDSYQVLPVPKPIGGVLIFNVNSLLYLNQSVPPYGVSLNSLTETSTAFPLKPQEGAKISFDCCQATFINFDRVVVSLKGGELYVLTLVTDGMRSVRSFNIDKAAASVLTSCICLCEEGYLFLGSRLGNSLLLHYVEKSSKDLPINETAEEEIVEVQPSGAPTSDTPTSDAPTSDAPTSDAPTSGAPTSGAPTSGDITEEDQPPVKKKRLDTLGDWMASNVTDIQDCEELEVYGSEAQTATQITQYTFEVCDSLINIGPLCNISMGEPAFLSEEYSGSIDPDVELVSTSGHAKNGALSVLQRTIRPQVVTTFQLPGCTNMWTVIGSKLTAPDKTTNGFEKSEDVEEISDDDEGKSKEGFEDSHAFLIISRDESTMILQTGQEINELDHSGFSTQSQTVFAGNIGENKYIVQVTPVGVRLLEGVNQLQHIPLLDIGSEAVFASIADPYLIIMCDDGQVLIMTLRNNPNKQFKGGRANYSARLFLTKPTIDQSSKIITLCAYKDVSGLFSCKIPSYALEEETNVAVNQNVKPSLTSRKVSIDPVAMMDMVKEEDIDEDDLLYSTDKHISPMTRNNPKTEIKSENLHEPIKETESEEIKESHWLVVCRQNGVLQVLTSIFLLLYSLPDMKMVYVVRNFSLGYKVLVDSITIPGSSGEKVEKSEDNPLVKEILLVGLGNMKKRPLLMARVGEEVLLYEAFVFADKQTAHHLKIRFCKISHNMILQAHKLNRSSTRKKSYEGLDPKAEENADAATNNIVSKLCYFEDIAGYSGVFICGAYPYWIFMTSHGELRLHPMAIDGHVPIFAPFHNINCVRGFLYFNKSEELRICVLPTHLSYDAPWPVRKVPLRCTPHYVTYHVESKTYCVVTSYTEMCTRLVKHTGEEKEFEFVERDDRFIYPNADKFIVQLFSPVNWEAIPNTKLELDDWEHATCMKNVSLVSEGTMSGLKGYIAIATNYNYGEDVTSRGRIMIHDIIEVVPEPGQPLTKNKLKQIYCKEQKGPVTTLCQVQGFLLTCIGQKIYVWQLKDNDLIGIAFIDTNIYIHSAVSIKNLVLVADICKSVNLLCYQEQSRTLALVSRDIKPMEVYAIEYFVDHTQLGFVVSDVDKNIVIYTYQPDAKESFGGQCLLHKVDFHAGAHINCFFRIRCKLTHLLEDKKAFIAAEKRQMTLYGTQDGGMGYMLPISEKVYRRLLMLQNLLVTNIPHYAGLNPKGYSDSDNSDVDYEPMESDNETIDSYKSDDVLSELEDDGVMLFDVMYKSRHRQLLNAHKNTLDGNLLFKFNSLSLTEKKEFSKKIGTHVESVMNDLMEIDRCTAHF
ncbi:Cleavage and polyadenylation specificity factor subunit 1 [Nymphon striatum]|nr:Cleavage and polyadenylation specificity factor subunit 1 [Nymphon striatum]